MKLKQLFINTALALLVVTPKLNAHEGLWLPALAKNENYKAMKAMGFTLKADDIYSDSKPDLTEAMAALTSAGQDLQAYASASFISDEGLIITNHHAVFNHLERFSTDQNDFMKHGYWAQNREEETVCRGLQVTLLIHQEEVTKELTKGLEKVTDSKQRKDMINQRSKALGKKMDAIFPGSITQVSSCMAGNGYILNTYMVYKDVRMVAAPPMQIGRYAGQEDNWQWPRHTGDFAILRVYADKDNKPAEYSKENLPYRPAKWLPISKQGVKEGDFTMVMGYPASTREYIPSFALDKIVNEQNAARVKIRESKLELLKEAIGNNPQLRLRYTSRMHTIENSYLRWKGEIEGVKSMNLVAQKEAEEAQFQKWIEADAKRKAKYGDVLQQLRTNYEELGKYNYADVYFQEAGLQGAEIVPVAGKFEKLMAMFDRSRLNEKVITAEA
ncbi:MAG: S46 family peptidase, partial [Phocaeicola sp.]